jgi:hypothetical protein
MWSSIFASADIQGLFLARDGMGSIILAANNEDINLKNRNR